MIRGTTRFKCNECGNKFTGIDMEWCATVYTVPVRCPQCGSMHTYPVRITSLFGLFGPDPIYRAIWKGLDKEITENK